MKKIVRFFVIIVFAITVIALSSCRIADSGTGNISGNLNDANSDAKAVYGPGIQTTIIVPQNAEFSSGAFASITGVSDELYSYFGNLVHVRGDDKVKDTNEIVVGNTNREISNMAYKKLQRSFDRAIDTNEDTSFVMGYGIYAYQGSVAIVFTDDMVIETAIDYFVDNFITNDSLVLDDGYFVFQTINYIESLREKESEQRELAFSDIRNEYGDEVVTKLRAFLDLYDDRFYLWLADLYEPGSYDADGNPLGGGFYFSNSGRNTVGYGVDLESTYQVVSFLRSSGMATSNDDLKDILPESFFEEIAAFVISCQSPENGYFYHPQWGTDITVERRGRDLDWATSLLSLCGKSPNWNTPNGKKGAYGNPPGASSVSALTLRLNDTSAVSATSKVVATASTWSGDANLASLSAWESYVKSFETSIDGGSYGVGNKFSAMASQIVSRDKIALANGELKDANGDGIADGGYIEVWEKYFNLWQNPSNGLWATGSVEEGTITYNAVNGLMKISAAYNSLGIKLNYADKAYESAMVMATHIGNSNDGSDWADVSGKKPEHVVDVYNVFQSMLFVSKNASTFGDGSEISKMQASLKDNASELIDVTMRKIAKFKKNDGSFGYTWDEVIPVSQGALVAVAGTIEGDVNGGTIAVQVVNNVISLLGISSQDLKPYSHSDLLVFSDRISKLSQVIKDPEVVEDPSESLLTFEEDEEGVLPSYVSGSFVNGGAEIVLSENNRYLALSGVPGKSGNAVTFNTAKTSGYKSLVLEWDMKIDNIQSTLPAAIQINLTSSYILTFDVNKNGTFTIGDMSGYTGAIMNNFDVAFNANEWNHIRVEYYVINAQEKQTVTYIYVNGYLRFISDNYYGKESGKNPVISYTGARFYAVSSANLMLCLDNVNAYQSNVRYSEKKAVNPDRIKDFENVDVGGAELPTGVTTIGGEVSIVPADSNNENKAMIIDKAGEKVMLDAIPSKIEANCFAAYMKLKVDSSKLGEVAKIYLARTYTKSALVAYSVEVYEENGRRSFRLVEFNEEGIIGESFAGFDTDTWVEIGIEFYPSFFETDKSIIIYHDGKMCGHGNLYYSRETLALDYTKLIVTTESNSVLAIDDMVAEVIYKTFISSSGMEQEDPDVVLPTPGNYGSGDYYNDESYAADYKYSYDDVTAATKNNGILHGTSGYGSVPIENGALKFNATAIGLTNKGNKTGAKYIFETDFYIASAMATKTADQLGWIGMSASKYDKTSDFAILGIYYTADEEGNITEFVLKDYPEQEVITTLKVDKWQNIRIEYTPSSTARNQGEVAVYIDGVLKASYTTKGYGGNSSQGNAYFECASIEFRGSSSCGLATTYKLDNTFIGAIGEAPGGNGGDDADDPIMPPVVEEGNRGSGTYYNDESYEDTYKYDYEGITSATKTNGMLHSTSGYGTVTVEDGALSFDTRSFGLVSQGAKSGLKYVFETDLCILGATATMASGDLGWFGMSASSASRTSNFALFTLCYTAEDGKMTKVVIKDTPTGTTLTEIDVNKWYNIRIEYEPSATKINEGTVKFYIDGVIKASYDTKGYGDNASQSNASLECFHFEIRGSGSSGVSTTYKCDNTFIGAVGQTTGEIIPPVVEEGNRGNGTYYNDASYDDTYKYDYEGITTASKTNGMLHSTSGYGTVTVEEGTLSFGTRSFGLVNQSAKTGTKYVFETDFYMASATANTSKTKDDLGWFGMSASSASTSTFFAYFSISYTADNGTITRVMVKDWPTGTIIADLAMDEWQNIRVEYTPSADKTNEGTVEFYLNGELKASYETKGASNNATQSNESFECFGFEIRGSSSSGVATKIKCDNTFIGAIE